MSIAELKLDLVKQLMGLPEKEFMDAYWILTQLMWGGAEGADAAKPKSRPIGYMKGLISYMADDFDAPLDDFNDYMPI
jgi:hypothetical protein